MRLHRKPLLILIVILTLPGFASGQALLERAPGRVTIVRDDWGVPHLYAAREEDGYYGLGYAMAEDRLENLLRRYLAAESRLASAFGRDSVEKDLWKLRWMHLENARASLARSSPQMQRDYTSFIRGIERYIAEHPEKIPAWAPKLDPALIVAWNRSWLFDWGEGLDKCAQAGAPISPEVRVSVAKDARPLPASNAWALSPWRSADNAAILVGDSHSSFTGNGEMYEFHIDAGDVKVTGTGGLGNPWAIVGHTRYLAWTTTNRNYDVSDCYEIEVDPTNPRRYRFDGSWREMSVRRVTVPVKNGPSVTREFDYTSHNGVLNPVVARSGTKAWVISSPYATEFSRFDEQMYQQLKSRTLDQFIAAQQMNQMWPTNVMVAESQGNIYYLRAGRTPIRPEGYDWAHAVREHGSATAWRGIYSVASLVQIRNPPTGYMQNNNVSPDMMFEGSELTSDRYPRDVFSDNPGNTNYRGQRAIDLLSRTFAARVADMARILFDEKWDRANLWTEALRGALNRAGSPVRTKPVEWRSFAQSLAEFDGFVSRESVAALRHLYWRRALSENQQLNREMVAMTFRDSVPGARYDSVLIAAVGRAMILLKTDFGSVDRAFGDIHRTGRGGKSWPMGGFVGTMRAMQYSDPDSAGRKWVFSGQRQPLVVIFSDPVQSYSQLNFGESGDASSPHFSDQAQLMSEKRMKSTYFNESDLLKHVESRLDLNTR
ncbi:MAG: acyl-homoserine-lactone acylase [Gemmatimonadaceae bacterium]|nr:acyl-homoserine-lactone acylase [Gemmatimonadaceae bacterium]